ncbi:MAG: replication initiator protein [Arizlama microvirus]|nr:MAG: replication initiator protein [Arizlama microvirus]
MPCYHPLTAYRDGTTKNTKTGKHPLVFKHAGRDFNPGISWIGTPQLQIPCGQCVGCRLERSRQWAMRCLHESSLYKRNCFITLTYDNKHLPSDESIHVREFQLFMKKLRKAYPNDKIRFFHCGEYGELCGFCRKPKYIKGRPDKSCKCKIYRPELGRPHYHACLFNFDFDQVVFANDNRGISIPTTEKRLFSDQQGIKLYTSKRLEEIWGNGYCTIGEVTFDSAAYVARYIMKKINGEHADKYYDGRTPEYTTMSRGGKDEKKKNLGGIARKWYEQNREDIYPHDYVVVNGKKVHPPKYYDTQLQKEDEKYYERIKEDRLARLDYIYDGHSRDLGAPATTKDNSDSRLAVKEEIKNEIVKKLSRNKF